VRHNRRDCERRQIKDLPVDGFDCRAGKPARIPGDHRKRDAILPGGTVYASASIPYIEGTETLAPTGAGATGSPARVTSEFYE